MRRRKFHKTISKAAFLAYLSPIGAFKPLKNAAPLQKGDRIRLIVPGSPITKLQLEIALANIRKLGLEPEYDDRVLLEYGYLAGKDDVRANQINEALEDDKIKAIWAIRGGYGCTRILPKLNADLLRANSKPLLGYSDITALLVFWDRYSGNLAFHAPVLKENWNSKQLDHLEQVLFSEKVVASLGNLEVIQGNAVSVTGQMTGGNLSVLAALCGTDWEWNIEDKIIFLEDIGEDPYRIDRMLHQLHQSTDFNQAKAILLGGFTDCTAAKGKPSFTTKETLQKFFGSLALPVWYGAPFGHISEQIVLPVNKTVILDSKNLKWDYI